MLRLVRSRNNAVKARMLLTSYGCRLFASAEDDRETQETQRTQMAQQTQGTDPGPTLDLLLSAANTSRWHRALNGQCDELHGSAPSCVLNASQRCHAALLPVYLPGIPTQAVPSVSPRNNDFVRPTKADCSWIWLC